MITIIKRTLNFFIIKKRKTLKIIKLAANLHANNTGAELIFLIDCLKRNLLIIRGQLN